MNKLTHVRISRHSPTFLLPLHPRFPCKASLYLSHTLRKGEGIPAPQLTTYPAHKPPAGSTAFGQTGSLGQTDRQTDRSAQHPRGTPMEFVHHQLLGGSLHSRKAAQECNVVMVGGDTAL